jgi:hypothetical protein
LGAQNPTRNDLLRKKVKQLHCTLFILKSTAKHIELPLSAAAATRKADKRRETKRAAAEAAERGGRN